MRFVTLWSRRPWLGRKFRSASPPLAGASGLALVLWLALGALAACQAPPTPAPVREVEERSLPPQVSAPPALFQPLSWSKLESLELWLDGPGLEASAALRIEVELALAEGRATYAKLDRSKLTPMQLKARIEAARAGFQLVVSSASASSTQGQRARQGLDGLEVLEPKTAPVVQELVTRAQWGAAPGILSRLIKNVDGWNRITVHHSADSNGERTAGSSADARQALRNLQRFHMRDPGHNWGDIGYHFLIDPQGRVYEGRSLTWQGAHAGGDNNKRNIGICLLGDYESSAPPKEQVAALEPLIESLRTRFNIPRAQVFGHQEFKDTLCPGPVLMGWVKSYRAKSSSSASKSQTAAQPKAASRAGLP